MLTALTANKYHQSNGRCSGRKILDKKDIIQLPPFGFSAEEESERIRNIALRNKEIELEHLAAQETQQKKHPHRRAETCLKTNSNCTRVYGTRRGE